MNSSNFWTTENPRLQDRLFPEKFQKFQAEFKAALVVGCCVGSTGEMVGGGC